MNPGSIFCTPQGERPCHGPGPHATAGEGAPRRGTGSVCAAPAGRRGRGRAGRDKRRLGVKRFQQILLIPAPLAIACLVFQRGRQGRVSRIVRRGAYRKSGVHA